MVKSKYKYISWKDLIKFLKKYYFAEVVSQKWSHIKIKLKISWKVSIIPNHKELAYWTFSWILLQLWLDENEIIDKLK